MTPIQFPSKSQLIAMSQLRLIRISLILTALVAIPTHAQMDAAQRSMNAGFNQLRGMIQDQENIDNHNWNVQKNNNTQAYLDAVYSHKTVRDLLANREALERMRIGYGAQIDRDIARGAFDARLYSLMQQEQLLPTGR